MYRPAFGAGFALAVFCLAASLVSAQSQSPPAAPASDLDAFMEKVLARREVNRKTLNDYILDEVETFEILGPGRMRLHRTDRDYTWYVRDGKHVRSPVRFNGVAVGPEARDRYEAEWIRREERRRAREAERAKERETSKAGQSGGDRQVVVGPGGVEVSGGGVPTEPRFVSEAYFMDFKFEPGNYLLAGRETFEGQPVLRIEYYPTKLFGDDDRKAPREIRKDVDPKTGKRELEDDIERRMNKTAQVTLWVDPALHQIVKYTFENVWLDFLPGAWLVRVDGMRASMTMGQPFPGVWLPRDIDIEAGITLANGSFEARYGRDFSEYREAQVATKIRIPKDEPEQDNGDDWEAGDAPRPAVPSQTQSEVIREVRVHGNAFLSDADVLAIAAISVGDSIGPDTLDAIERRLRDSRRFETIEVRKRYRSLSDPSDVAIVLVVHEEPGIRSIDDPTSVLARPFLKARQGVMFLPIVGYDDGYGLTYGARFSINDTLGLGERISVPLTWGGTRRAAVEIERSFDRGPLTRVMSSVGIWQRENPAFQFSEEPGADDRRVEWMARAERNFAQVVLTGVEVTRANVRFGPFPSANQWTVGADAALDTRGDPAFPRNAVYLGVGWNGLHYESDPLINRFRWDGRGYLGLVGQLVAAGRIQYFTADATMPLHERYLIGGASTLRGIRAGSFDADRALVTSAELRLPITSVISGAKLGVTVFHDAAKSVDFGSSLRDAEWERSTGGGVFLLAPLVKLNLDVAKAHGGGSRVHLATGFAF